MESVSLKHYQSAPIFTLFEWWTITSSFSLLTSITSPIHQWFVIDTSDNVISFDRKGNTAWNRVIFINRGFKSEVTSANTFWYGDVLVKVSRSNYSCASLFFCIYSAVGYVLNFPRSRRSHIVLFATINYQNNILG